MGVAGNFQVGVAGEWESTLNSLLAAASAWAGKPQVLQEEIPLIKGITVESTSLT